MQDPGLKSCQYNHASFGRTILREMPNFSGVMLSLDTTASHLLDQEGEDRFVWAVDLATARVECGETSKWLADKVFRDGRGKKYK